MTEKEKPGAKRTRKEAALKDASMLDLYREEKYPIRKLRNAIAGEDEYGTSLSKGAMQAADDALQEHRGTFGNARKTQGQVDFEGMQKGREAAREAAAEERREARGMKKGGKVSSASKRADGIAQRGKTRGMMK